jgi:hypothetical protein
MDLPDLPTCILHADWSMHPYKRQMAAAWLEPDGSYIAHAPISVPDPRRLVSELSATIGPSGCALVGFDFPIGLPIAYAQKVAVSNFLTALPQFGQGEWQHFYEVASAPADITLHRPFYPARPGNTSQSQLLEALGFIAMDQLRRMCERAHTGRRAAAPLFWIMGGQQVGKAAISGWRDVLGPALREQHHNFRIWPFDGHLNDLLHPGAIVAAETYPAEFYGPLGIIFSRPRKSAKSGKRSISDRQMNASVLIQRAVDLQIKFSSELQNTIHAGFGRSPQAEDAFDALIGLLGMFMVVRGELSCDFPRHHAITRVEGWILGQDKSAGTLLNKL